MPLQSSLPLEPRKYIGYGGSAISVSSPILKLHDDLLWSIFDWNADMTEDKPRAFPYFSHRQALTTTLQSSRVCQRWRRILLYASSLWGKLLDLDTLSLGNDEWRDEILRRTGISLLSVRSSLQPLRESEHCREFFYSLFEKNWDRIRMLHISQVTGYDRYTSIDEARWSRILSFPAKKLESFRFLVDLHEFMSESPRILRLNPAGLFNNDAPMLTEFETSNTCCSTSFFPHLRIFSADFISVTSDFDVGQFLDALRHMNLLESLSLIHFSASPNKQRNDSTPVLLPRLMNIHLEGPLDCAILLDNVQPAVRCIFKLVITDESHKETELMRTAYRVVSWYAQNYCVTYSSPSLRVILSKSVTIIAIPDSKCKSSQFTIPLPESDAGVYEYLLLLNSFPLSTFPPITHLQLDMPYKYDVPCFKSLLSSFLSVEKLECPEHTIEKLNRISASEHFFPQLKILKLTTLSYYNYERTLLARSKEPLDESELPPFLKFLSKQWENGRPIEILDINHDDYFKFQNPRIQRFLNNLSQGLKVTCSRRIYS